MNEAGPAPGPSDGEAGSWASETLPLALRRELLQRELKKLGLGRREVASATPSVKEPSGADQRDDQQLQADASARCGS